MAPTSIENKDIYMALLFILSYRKVFMQSSVYQFEYIICVGQVTRK